MNGNYIISHLSTIKKRDTSVCPGAVLLIRPTGGGKSAARNVHSIMCTGVSLIITPPLPPLGEDQTQRMRQNASLNGGSVHANHLDELRCSQAQQLLSERLLLLLVDIAITIFLFSSPQAIVNNQLQYGSI
jgi:superfamily II DNA helicase RecQ